MGRFLPPLRIEQAQCEMFHVYHGHVEEGVRRILKGIAIWDKGDGRDAMAEKEARVVAPQHLQRDGGNWVSAGKFPPPFR